MIGFKPTRRTFLMESSQYGSIWYVVGIQAHDTSFGVVGKPWCPALFLLIHAVLLQEFAGNWVGPKGEIQLWMISWNMRIMSAIRGCVINFVLWIAEAFDYLLITALSLSLFVSLSLSLSLSLNWTLNILEHMSLFLFINIYIHMRIYA